jgi:hypothetical protein
VRAVQAKITGHKTRSGQKPGTIKSYAREKGAKDGCHGKPASTSSLLNTDTGHTVALAAMNESANPNNKSTESPFAIKFR